MRKRILPVALCVTAALGLFALAGCSGGESASAPENGSAALSGAISTEGSTSMEKVIGNLSEAYQLENDEVSITYNPTGSGSGIKAVQEGRCDVGLSSRDLKAEELESGLEGTVLAYDGISIVVNPENPINDLSVEQIAAIFTGEVTNWSEVGGDDAEIVVIGREAGSGTRDGFESVTETEDECQYRQELTSSGDVDATVSQNPNAIGYTSLTSVSENVKTLTVGGVEANEETIKDGSYPVQRPFLMVTKVDEPLSGAALDFFEWAVSADAAEIISGAGAVPTV